MASAQRLLKAFTRKCSSTIHYSYYYYSRVPSGKARTSRTFQTALARFGSLFYSHEL